MLDDLILDQFMTSFFGFGSFEAEYWFIGMEEGGGSSLEEASNRLATWEKGGEKELEDVRAYHEALNLNRYFSDPVALQPTWTQLIRIYLVSNGLPDKIENIKAFQKEELGRKVGNTCLLELMPLPSPGTNRWNYAQWSDLPGLHTRKLYLETIRPR